MRKRRIKSEWYGDAVEMEASTEDTQEVAISDELLNEYMKENGGDEDAKKDTKASEPDEVVISPELEKEYLSEDTGENDEVKQKEVKWEFIGVIGLILGAGAVFSCLIMRVAHFPFVGLLSIAGIGVNVFSIITNRARVLALFGIILSSAGLGMVGMVILKLLRWL